MLSGSRILPRLCGHTARRLSTAAEAALPPVRGIDIVTNRVANMILNIADKKSTSVLHVYPENNALTYVGEVTYLSMTSLRNEETSTWRHLTDEHKYVDKITFPTFDSEPADLDQYDIRRHTMVVNAIPVYKTPGSSPSEAGPVDLIALRSLPVSTLARFTTSMGYLILGAPDALWKQLDIDSQIEYITNKGTGSMMASFRIPLPLDDLPTLPDAALDQPSSLLSFEAPTRVEKIRLGDLAKEANNERRSISYKLGILRINK